MVYHDTKGSIREAQRYEVSEDAAALVAVGVAQAHASLEIADQLQVANALKMADMVNNSQGDPVPNMANHDVREALRYLNLHKALGFLREGNDEF